MKSGPPRRGFGEAGGGGNIFSSLKSYRRIPRIRSSHFFSRLPDIWHRQRERLHHLETVLHRLQKRCIRSLRVEKRLRFLHWFREYSSLAVVISGACLVTGTNIAAETDSPGIVAGYFQESTGDQATENLKRQLSARGTSNKTNLALVPLANASLQADPDIQDTARAVTPEEMSEDQFLASTQAPMVLTDPEEDGGVTIYTVKTGDTVGAIAEKHQITINTVLWANDFDNVDAIAPGDEIFILPVAGLSHIVQTSDTIESIAKKFEADTEKIIAFNELPANGRLEAGQTIIIPGGRKEAPPPANPSTLTRRQYATSTGGTATDISGWRTPSGKAGAGHRFPFGYCTWYVAQKRFVPWGGNAGAWLYNAKVLGYKTGKTPSRGAIVVTTDSARYGHVALVEKVGNGAITVSEMNYNAWGKTNTRTIPVGSRTIRGYIY